MFIGISSDKVFSDEPFRKITWDMMETLSEIGVLSILAITVACIAWTVIHEEISKEPREFCSKKAKTVNSIYQRKFFYLFTCEYCFSHYISAIFILITGYHLLFNDWRGYLISFFALVFIANVYMTPFGLLRQNFKSEKIEIELKGMQMNKQKEKNT